VKADLDTQNGTQWSTYLQQGRWSRTTVTVRQTPAKTHPVSRVWLDLRLQPSVA